MPVYIYSNTPTLSVGSYLYTDSLLTTLASAGKYSNGSDCYTVDSNGQVTLIASCGTNYVYVYNTLSLNIPITGVEINGVSVTYNGGTNFTITAGNNGVFLNSQIGTYDITVYYGPCIAGQHILIEDSLTTPHCELINPGGGSITFVSADCSGNISITAADEGCF